MTSALSPKEEREISFDGRVPRVVLTLFEQPWAKFLCPVGASTSAQAKGNRSFFEFSVLFVVRKFFVLVRVFRGQKWPVFLWVFRYSVP